MPEVGCVQNGHASHCHWNRYRSGFSFDSGPVARLPTIGLWGEVQMVAGNEQVQVWDPLVRIFHWSLVAGFSAAYFSGDNWLRVHVVAGYTVAGLVAFRLVWGFIGTQHARFYDFVHPPAAVVHYVKEMIRSRARRHIGHNPAAGAMVIALLLSLTATALSGMALYGHTEFLGPLAGLADRLPDSAGGVFKEMHELLANLTVMLVLLHLAGVLFASLQHRENLVRAMLTGWKSKEVN